MKFFPATVPGAATLLSCAATDALISGHEARRRGIVCTGNYRQHIHYMPLDKVGSFRI